MTYRPTPTQTFGGRDFVSGMDDFAIQLLTQILEQLRVMNLHLSMMTDTTIEETN